jgi:hypothetical protein
MSVLFGKRGSNTSTSDNRSFDQINSMFSPMATQGQQGMDSMRALLGGDSRGFDAYKAATGFNPMVEEGSRGITGNAAAAGLLRSGSTGQSLQNYGNMMQNQYAENYLRGQQGLANTGLQAGQLIAGAGQRSRQESKAPKKGLLQYGLSGASLLAGGRGN